MLLAYSCADIYDSTEKIEVINQTKEDVAIYYYKIFDMEVTETTIRSDETRFIYVVPKRKYYAKGRSTNKEYGERVFISVPSNVYDQQTWVIRE